MDFSDVCFLIIEVLPTVHRQEHRAVALRIINTLDLLDTYKGSPDHKKRLLEACEAKDIMEEILELMCYIN